MTPTSKPTIVGLIPARGGSKRVPGKNIRLLGGKPLIAWTIEAALESGVFSRVYVSSDDEETLRIAGHYDVVAMMRPEWAAKDESPDVDWVRHTLGQLEKQPDVFAILRPTSPFRTAETIKRAWEQLLKSPCHSLRAVQPVREHPGKMWQISYGVRMWPLIGQAWPPRGNNFPAEQCYECRPWHSMPTQMLPEVYVQNASLEMAWTFVLRAFDTISGTHVAPFFTEGREGFDINTEDDWSEAERLACQLTLA